MNIVFNNDGTKLYLNDQSQNKLEVYDIDAGTITNDIDGRRHHQFTGPG